MKSLDDMTEPELTAVMRATASAAKDELPPETGFIILATPWGKSGVAQYISNVQRADAAKWMIETLTRWGQGDLVPRVGD